MGIKELNEQMHSLESKTLEIQKNPALKRLGNKIEKRGTLVDITNYSRMHNRHNRS